MHGLYIISAFSLVVQYIIWKKLPFTFRWYFCSFHEAKKAATVKNQATKMTSSINGMTGNNNVNIISPTAIDPSSINSIAILILVHIKQSNNNTTSRVIPPIIKNTIQVDASSRYEPMSAVNSKPPKLNGSSAFPFNSTNLYPEKTHESTVKISMCFFHIKTILQMYSPQRLLERKLEYLC